MEKPVPGKVVRRAVTEVVTPGVTTDDALLDHNTNNFLATLTYGKNDYFGAAFLDISTGEFFVSEGDAATIDKLLQSFKPAEVVLPKSRLREFSATYGDKFYSNTLEDWIFTHDFAREKLLLPDTKPEGLRRGRNGTRPGRRRRCIALPGGNGK
jgi:DNA mismatch repair protein MutS